ncbi:MAG: hypothetical protein J6Z30_04320, partial [Pyramidobacter sp.]|nr:hypothetical protein [Pyramidobacter sp.]
MEGKLRAKVHGNRLWDAPALPTSRPLATTAVPERTVGLQGRRLVHRLRLAFGEEKRPRDGETAWPAVVGADNDVRDSQKVNRPANPAKSDCNCAKTVLREVEAEHLLLRRRTVLTSHNDDIRNGLVRLSAPDLDVEAV